MRFIPLLSVIFLFSSQGLLSQNILDDWTVKWQHSSDYMIEIAEKMPAETYEFTPTEEQMSFSDQLLHLSYNMVSLSERFLDTEPLDPPLPDTFRSKEEALRHVQRAFRHTADQVRSLDPEVLTDTVDFWAGPVPKSRIIWLITDHLAHHRGQLIVYLRLQGINPPDYRGW